MKQWWWIRVLLRASTCNLRIVFKFFSKLPKLVLLQSTNEVCEGYVFTSVCQEFCPQKGGNYSGRYASYWNAFLLSFLCNFKWKLERWSVFHLLVFSYVLCERLSVMNYTFQLVEFLVQNSLSAPTQVFQECWSGVPLLPLKIKNLSRSWHFGCELAYSNTPPPRKWKCGQLLALWIWVSL